MDANDSSKQKTGAILLVVVVIAVLGWVVFRNTGSPADTGGTAPLVPTANTEAFKNVSNPAQEVGGNVPETNPFTETKANPFSGYTNPFSR